MKTSISGVYAALADSRRLRILLQFESSRCLPLHTIARKIKCSLPVVLYEISILEKSNLVRVELPDVCLTEEGLEVLRKVKSINQNLTESEINSAGKFVDMITLRGFSVLLRIFYRFTIPVLLLSLALSLLLLVLSGGTLIGIIPVPSRWGPISTSLSLLTMLTMIMLVVYSSTGRLSTVDVVLSYFTLCSLSLISVPIYELVYTILGVSTLTVLISEIARLVLPVIAVAVVSNILSYSSGRTFEWTFLLISVLILIPSLTIYGLILQLSSIP